MNGLGPKIETEVRFAEGLRPDDYIVNIGFVIAVERRTEVFVAVLVRRMFWSMEGKSVALSETLYMHVSDDVVIVKR